MDSSTLHTNIEPIKEEYGQSNLSKRVESPTTMETDATDGSNATKLIDPGVSCGSGSNELREPIHDHSVDRSTSSKTFGSPREDSSSTKLSETDEGNPNENAAANEDEDDELDEDEYAHYLWMIPLMDQPPKVIDLKSFITATGDKPIFQHALI
ncbi:hypothetical protein BU23DRAFT_663796 [Bimuria novae-zelandiae CBS 107.79]|uniref:Uncharacterized protein n=1 Tax=Bimuria novae-zelandiae CBS 107.79 TaxID=1447943 RepID=A0A6A5ULR1_9PLEO|nr:hypothetical protein BU23DRAFT_663796 [Bimuria novae-zelandiae CBS 107.79]